MLGQGVFPISSLQNNIQETILTTSLSLPVFSDNINNPFLSSENKFRAESPDFLLVEASGIKAAVPPGLITPQVLGALAEGFDSQDSQKIIVEYLVESGDTVSSLAERFNVSASTILWANNLDKNSSLKIGQKLVIPPVSGVIHLVRAGDTVSEIAQKYKAKVQDILAFNELSSESDIYSGDVLIVPDGIIPALSPKIAPQLVPLANSYFICPIAAPCRITQGLHWSNAVDFSHGRCGEPIVAAAGGKILKVKLTNSTSRWAFGGAGNHLTILHPNGVVTFYGHLANSFVDSGDEVSQGQIVALMGGQPRTSGAGKSTGCHLHFGVSGARNPFSK